MKQELKQLKEEKERLEASGQRPGMVVASNVPGASKGASVESRAPKKKKMSKQKRYPGLSSEERQEYYKSHLTHL